MRFKLSHARVSSPDPTLLRGLRTRLEYHSCAIAYAAQIGVRVRLTNSMRLVYHVTLQLMTFRIVKKTVPQRKMCFELKVQFSLCSQTLESVKHLGHILSKDTVKKDLAYIIIVKQACWGIKAASECANIYEECPRPDP